MSFLKGFFNISIVFIFICFTAILFSSARHCTGAGERGAATCQGLKNVAMIECALKKDLNFHDCIALHWRNV